MTAQSQTFPWACYLIIRLCCVLDRLCSEQDTAESDFALSMTLRCRLHWTWHPRSPTRKYVFGSNICISGFLVGLFHKNLRWKVLRAVLFLNGKLYEIFDLCIFVWESFEFTNKKVLLFASTTTTYVLSSEPQHRCFTVFCFTVITVIWLCYATDWAI